MTTRCEKPAAAVIQNRHRRRSLPAAELIRADDKSIESIAQRLQRLAISPRLAAVIPGYLASQRRYLEEAQVSLDSHELAPIARFGHNLQGTGRGYGFIELERIGGSIGTAIESGDEAEVAAQLELLRQFLNALKFI